MADLLGLLRSPTKKKRIKKKKSLKNKAQNLKIKVGKPPEVAHPRRQRCWSVGAFPTLCRYMNIDVLLS